MDVKYLNYILAIARHKNMTIAAEELFVSQSSLSQYLSRLEQELGTPLFYRTKTELVPTPAGELYIDSAKKVVAIQKELYHNIAALNHRGNIRIGVTSNFGMRMLSELIPDYKKTYPDVSIEISELGLPALKKMIMEESLDLGIAAVPNLAPFADQAKVLRKELILFAVPSSHPYAKKHPNDTLTPQELARAFSNENFLNSKRGSSLRIVADQILSEANFTPHAFCETNNIAATRNMIAHGNGVAFIAESCAVDRDRITYYSFNPPLFRLNALFNRKNWKPSEAEQVFYQLLLHYFDSITESPYLAESHTVSN